MDKSLQDQIPNEQKQRIYRFAVSRGYSRSGFEVHCKLANGFFRSIGTPSGKTIQRIIKAFPELNPDYIVNGILPMELPSHRRGVQDKQSVDAERPVAYNAPAPESIYKAVPEPGQLYTPVTATINVPASILDDLRDQLKKKDKQLEEAAVQIRTLLSIINNRNDNNI